MEPRPTSNSIGSYKGMTSGDSHLLACSFEYGSPAFICTESGALYRSNKSFDALFCAVMSGDRVDSVWGIFNLDEETLGDILGSLAGNGDWCGEIDGYFPEGTKYYFSLSIKKVASDTGADNFYIGHVLDLTRQKDTEETLDFAKQLAEQANIAKSRFLAKMSHEIRSPLNAIINMTQFLLESDLAVREQQFARVANQGGQTLMALINDILDFSKIEAGYLEIYNDWFDIAAMTREVVELFWTNAAEAGIELVSVIDIQCPPRCKSDVTRIRQILINLINNAIKFTSEGGVIVRLVYDEERSMAIFTVEDSGIGIDDAYKEVIFSEFQQVEDEENRRFGGTGLGLSIVKQLTGALRGAVSVESEVGKGSQFVVEIPMEIDVVESRPLVSLSAVSLRFLLDVDDEFVSRSLVEQLEQFGVSVGSLVNYKILGSAGVDKIVIVSDSDEKLLDSLYKLGIEEYYNIEENDISRLLVVEMGQDTSKVDHSACRYDGFLHKPISDAGIRNIIHCIEDDLTLAETDAQEISATDDSNEVLLPPAKILLAEDSPSNQAVALALMDWEGADVKVADNGREALQLATEHLFDIILMDLSMPEMDGLEATSRIRTSNGHNAKTTIVALTANAFAEDKASCLAAGMDDYIQKPIDTTVFTEKLAYWLCPDGVCFVNNDREPEVAEESTSEGEDLLDYKVLKQLIRDTSMEVLPKILNIYFRETEGRIPEMLLLHEQQLWTTLGEQAHILKSSSGSFGAIKLSAQAKMIELSVKSNDLASVDRAMSGLEGLSKASLDAHQAYLRELIDGQ